MSVPDDVLKRATVDRLLSTANAHRLRGDLVAAEDSCREAIQVDPENARLGEMLGDLLEARGLLEDARAQYHGVMERNPGLASVEKKLAKLALEMDERARERRSVEDALGKPEDTKEIRRSAGIALALSLAVPGVGQIYVGEITKGIIILGSFLVSIIVMAVSGETASFIKQMFAIIMAGSGGSADTSVWPSAWLLLFFGVGMFSYIYGVVDAPITAAKRARGEHKGGKSASEKA